MTAELLFWMVVAHFAGDYLFQSDWMATQKTQRWLPAVVHGVVYGVPFAFLVRTPWALLVVVGTHILIDRYRLVRYLIWAKNQIGPASSRSGWEDSKATGYPSATPVWLSTWLMIIFDNVIHIVINFLAVKYL